MKEPIFKATHIVKQFGPTIALNDVDIEIFPGEIRGFQALHQTQLQQHQHQQQNLQRKKDYSQDFGLKLLHLC